MRKHVTKVWQQTIEVAPARSSLNVALHAAATLAVPLVLLAVFDRLDWAMYAGFGAFSAVYGRYAKHGVRLWMQLTSGATQVLVMLLGTLTSFLDAPFVLKVLMLGVVAWGSNWASRGFGWTPPGPIFAVFAAGACASVPATAQSFLGILVVGAGTAIFGVLIMLSLSLRHAQLRQTLRPAISWTSSTEAIKESTLMGVATAAAALAATAAGGEHWYWAGLAGIAGVTGRDVHSRITRGFQRCLGTCVGVMAVGALFSFDPPVWILLVVAIAGQVCIELVILRNYAIGMIFMTVVALLMVHLVSPEPAMTLVTDRLYTTVLGVLVGVVLSLVLGLLDARRGRDEASTA